MDLEEGNGLAKAFTRITVPMHWAGMTKDSREGPAFACGACPDPDACIDNNRTCRRARPEDFER
jgi:hypothetical protein